ncbi:sensor histidine kinase [uncultured Robinsoniella sp.]|uniref:sensor histidine kinase n=1 Tax=uncultured Robinsoniella sp. TaxID=904190 RepID=UPI00374E65CB
MAAKFQALWIYRIFYGAAVIMLAIFSILVWHVTDHMLMRGLLIGFGIGFLGIGAAVIAFMRKQITGFTDSMSACLDEMLDEKEDIIFDDISETLLSKLQSKLMKLYEILQRHNQKSLEEKMAIQSLVSDISHQTKTPVANIKMYAGILQDREVERGKQKEFLQSITVQVNKLDFLIQAMIKMSRLETGIFQMQMKRASVYETLGMSLNSIFPKAEEKGIDLSVTCSEELFLSHDVKWTAEALANVLDNAVKYTPCGGKIIVSAERQEFYSRISIRDTGRGIPEKNQASIFKRFYREKEVHDQEGVGIGLYLTREIITLQGGYVEVRSKPREGAEFMIFLTN